VPAGTSPARMPPGPGQDHESDLGPISKGLVDLVGPLAGHQTGLDTHPGFSRTFPALGLRTSGRCRPPPPQRRTVRSGTETGRPRP
jgi:hypothetical protein